MSALTLTYTATANTVAPSAQYNLNNSEIVTWSTTIDHSNTVGSTGFYASDIKPLTAAEATFGATATGVGYTFLANDITATPLTATGVSGQTAPLFTVNTIAGTPAFRINVNGNASLFSAMAFGTPLAALNAGSVGLVNDNAATNGLVLNVPTGSTNGYRFFVNGAAGTLLMQLSSAGLVNVLGSLVCGGGYAAGPAGSLVSALSSSTGQLTLGGTGASLTGAGQFNWDGAKYNFFNSGAVSSTANILGSTGAYTPTSDGRLKENVVDIALGIDTLMQLRPVSFDWIESKEPSQGFIAQEVQSIVPHAVRLVDADRGILGITDALLTPVIVKSIQQLAAKLDAYISAHP